MKTVLLPLVLLVALVLGSTSAAFAQSGAWTSAGSTGTVDEAGAAIVDVTGAQIRIKAGAPLPATLVVRYNVTATADLLVGFPTGIRMRFKDTGAGARVVAVVKRVNLFTSATTSVLNIDSNSAAASPDFQTLLEVTCFNAFDFASNVYSVEVTITKASELDAPALQALQLFNSISNCP